MTDYEVEETHSRLNAGTILFDMMEASERGNAERLSLVTKGRAKWVETWGHWIVFQDGRWVYDLSLTYMNEWCKATIDFMYAMANKIKPSMEIMEMKDDDRMPDERKAYEAWKAMWDWTNKSNRVSQYDNMIKLARGMRGMAVKADEIDAKPWLLNVLSGTIDLKEGIHRTADPGDLLTKQAPVIYDEHATCPQWRKYLAQWQPRQDVQDFLRRVCGSGITGEPVQNLFMNLGEGANGKGTFYKRIQLVLGEYAATAPENMIVKTRNVVHEEQKAKLRGCRFLLAPETDANDRLDEAGIKNLTGGDLINARHLYGKPFEFVPTHTAFLHTNHSPRVQGTDIGIWRRVVLIPWETYIKAEDRDPQIDTILSNEHSGILNWLIQGALEWRDRGLDMPPSIKVAGDLYRKDQDHIGNFLTEKLGGGFVKMTAGTLRTAYTDWCEEEGVRPWSAVAVGRELTRRGYVVRVERNKDKTERVWRSEVRNTESAPDQDPVLSVMDVTSLFTLSPDRNQEKEVRKVEDKVEKTHHLPVTHNTDETEVPYGHPDWLPDEEWFAERDRLWMLDKGFDLPTDEEIEEYLNTTESDNSD